MQNADVLRVRGSIWLGFDENTGEFTGEYCTVKPHDLRGMRPFVAAEEIAKELEKARAIPTEEMIELGAKACRHITLNALTMDECRDAVRAALTAALACEPALSKKDEANG
ncbi:hypothetical protein [Hyphomicrobium sp.]|uniref:hypothetical protein n=1 Tax=Hyphomicrobium sp. TaxID=82 RepID=UPI002FDE3D4B